MKNSAIAERVGKWLIELYGDDVVIVREDGRNEPEPRNWRELFADFLGMAASTVIVGAKRLTDDGKHIFSMGENVIHPKGLHLVGQGLPAIAHRFPEEVDCFLGGVFAVKRQYFEQLAYNQLLEGELGSMQLCLAARIAGGRIYALPEVVVQDGKYAQPTVEEIKRFYQIFGFDWVAPDLDVVKEKYRGRDLLWNMKYFSNAMPFEKYEERGAMHWQSYGSHEAFKMRADNLVKFAVDELAGELDEKVVVDLGCGDGLYSHLLAKNGVKVIGIEAEKEGVEQSVKMCESQDYPGDRPQFMQGFAENIKLEDGCADLVILFDVIEHVVNPIRVLSEMGRILKKGGKMMVVTPMMRYGSNSDPVYHNFEYSNVELQRQMNCVRGVVCEKVGKYDIGYNDIVAIGVKQ